MEPEEATPFDVRGVLSIDKNKVGLKGKSTSLPIKGKYKPFREKGGGKKDNFRYPSNKGVV